MSRKDSTITFRLTRVQKEFLEMKLKKLGMSKSQFIRDAITLFAIKPAEEPPEKWRINKKILALEQERAILNKEEWKLRDKAEKCEGELRTLERGNVSKESSKYQSWQKRKQYYEKRRLEILKKRKEVDAEITELADQYLKFMTEKEITASVNILI